MSQSRVTMLLDVLQKGTYKKLIEPKEEHEKIHHKWVAELSIFTKEEIDKIKEDIIEAIKDSKTTTI